jgi:hypothetical protein
MLKRFFVYAIYGVLILWAFTLIGQPLIEYFGVTGTWADAFSWFSLAIWIPIAGMILLGAITWLIPKHRARMRETMRTSNSMKPPRSTVRATSFVFITILLVIFVVTNEFLPDEKLRTLVEDELSKLLIIGLFVWFTWLARSCKTEP